jgi:hypothetical protein
VFGVPDSLRIVLGFVPTILAGMLVQYALHTEAVLRVLRTILRNVYFNQTNILKPMPGKRLERVILGNGGAGIVSLGLMTILSTVWDISKFYSIFMIAALGVLISFQPQTNLINVKARWEPMQPSGKYCYFIDILFTYLACLASALFFWIVRFGF